MLKTPEDRAALNWAVKQYPVIADKELSAAAEFWIRYSYGERDSNIAGNDTYSSIFIRALKFLERKAQKNTYLLLCSYIQYLRGSAMLGYYYDGLTPHDIETAASRTYSLLYISEKITVQSSVLYNMKNHEWLAEKLDSEKYYIQIADSPEQHINAGEELHNCLSTYCSYYKMNRNLAIGLIRDSADDTLLGAIEINTWTLKIQQARGKCNSELPYEIRQYLENYKKRKNLSS